MKVENGHNVKVHYRGTLSDGTEFDNSKVRGQTLEFQVGAGRMIRGFDSALLGMTEGQTKTITLDPDNAYGERDPNALQPVPKEAFGEEFEFRVGGTIQGNGPAGPFLAKIHALEEQNVILDMNHPLAGESLQFEIELVEVGELTPQVPAAPIVEEGTAPTTAELAAQAAQDAEQD
jgi:peptidylprolyl isomerase